MPFRSAIVILVAAAALALPSAALAFPTSPVLHWVSGPVTVWPGMDFHVGWEPSTFDPDATAQFYEVKVTKYPTGSTPNPNGTTVTTFACTYAIPLSPGYHYVVSVRAGEKFVGPFNLPSYSWSSWRTMQFDAVSLPVVDF